jgi:hypothetical protein
MPIDVILLASINSIFLIFCITLLVTLLCKKKNKIMKVIKITRNIFGVLCLLLMCVPFVAPYFYTMIGY